jgi:predicted nucleic acid-binding protein
MAAGSRVVVDTNVLFEGLTRQGGAAGLIVEAWLGGLLDVCVSNAVAYEYTAVLSRNLSDQRWAAVEPVLGALLARARYVGIYYSWRPTSPDPGDDHVIDCAMNAGAVVVTSNLKDFRLARETLGLTVLSPLELVTYLAE